MHSLYNTHLLCVNIIYNFNNGGNFGGNYVKEINNLVPSVISVNSERCLNVVFLVFTSSVVNRMFR
jgi:hypothetical protein